MLKCQYFSTFILFKLCTTLAKKTLVFPRKYRSLLYKFTVHSIESEFLRTLHSRIHFLNSTEAACLHLRDHRMEWDPLPWAAKMSRTCLVRREPEYGWPQDYRHHMTYQAPTFDPFASSICLSRQFEFALVSSLRARCFSQGTLECCDVSFGKGCHVRELCDCLGPESFSYGLKHLSIYKY